MESLKHVRGIIKAAVVLSVFLFPASSAAQELHPCYLDHAGDIMAPVASSSLLVEFRARANEFGMNVGGADWNAMVAIINAYELYYKQQMNVIDGYRATLRDEELTEAEAKAIIDDIHVTLKALDYRFIEDGYACREYIPDNAWNNYVDWLLNR